MLKHTHTHTQKKAGTFKRNECRPKASDTQQTNIAERRIFSDARHSGPRNTTASLCLCCRIKKGISPPSPAPPRPPSPVHAGVRPVVVEGLRRADAALFALPPAARRDGEGGATPLAGRHAGAVLHGGGTGDRWGGGDGSIPRQSGLSSQHRGRVH